MIKLWDLQGNPQIDLKATHANSVWRLAVTNGDQHVISASVDCTLRITALSSGEVIDVLEGHNCHVSGMVVTPDGGQVLSASHGNFRYGDLSEVLLWEVTSGEAESLWSDIYTKFNDVALYDGVALVALNNGGIDLVDTKDRQPRRRLEAHGSRVNRLVTLPEEGLFVSASSDGTVKIWPWQAEEPAFTLRGHEGPVRAVAVVRGAQGWCALSGGDDGRLKIWDLTTGVEVYSWVAHRHHIYDVCVMANQRYAISVGRDHQLRVWEWATGLHVATYNADAPLYCCAVAAAGGRVVAGDRIGRIHHLTLVDGGGSGSSVAH
jgi:WD40 repeat protein